MVGLMSGMMVNRDKRKTMQGMMGDGESMPSMKGVAGKENGMDNDMMGEPHDRDEQGEQPNVSPEEQAQYDQFIDNGLRLIFDKKTAPSILQRIEASPSPSEGLAAATVSVVTRLKDSAEQKGMKIDDAVLFHGGVELMENIAELSDAAGVHKFTPDEIEVAMYQALDQYGTREIERGTIDKQKVADEFKMMVEADKAGRIDELIPGLSQRAKEIKARGQGNTETRAEG